MKKLLISCLAVVLLGQQVFAAWAAHLVISPASLARDPKGTEGDRFASEAAKLARGVTVRPAARGCVSIVLKVAEEKRETGKGYYLIVSKKRLAPDALQLRSALRSKNRMSFEGSGNGNRTTVPEGIIEVRPLRLTQTNGESVIEVELDRESALRSYIVWDFQVIYEKGAMIMDGGLWLTYDLPAFVDTLDTAKKEKELKAK